ncbi:hypothetical protein CEV34_1181 [Brucella pseudogrignonensis]|uniref:Uncharacterized protein n=1 Tax=Brucella pseudogrignonensis TaxID=419475 RepID=A0A256GMZ5_9HYPH|nr:hypothetical protein CEV34_1181 [Brucella pseudogrignonensis]
MASGIPYLTAPDIEARLLSQNSVSKQTMQREIVDRRLG